MESDRQSLLTLLKNSPQIVTACSLHFFVIWKKDF